jgi:spermidine synthase
MTTRARRLLFVCFLLSGFTGLLYQTVWLRLSLAKFGVNSSVIAAVLSVFMLGLALGTILAGRYVERIEARVGFRGLQVYGLAELAIGIGGWAVPALLGGARQLLLSLGASDRFVYTTASAALLAAILLPFCTAMGMTFPAAVSYLRRGSIVDARRDAFSSLYLPNVAGALVGVLLTSFVLIEQLGFFTTSLLASGINGLIALVALFVAPAAGVPAPVTEASVPAPRPVASRASARLVALFLSGFATMGMEVVWTRIYPFYIGSLVYSFAAILAVYLVATALGSALYRWSRRWGGLGGMATWWPWLCVTGLLPLLSASITVQLSGPRRVLLGLMPFCFILGYLTPLIVDEEAGDDPGAVGRAYAMNLLGCVLGPLLAGFILIPALGTKLAALALALPLFVFLCAPPLRRNAGWVVRLVLVVIGSLAVLRSTTLFEDQFPARQVLNDATATVVAAGEKMEKHLFVNGVGMTGLTPITKMMVHFPAAHVASQAKPPLDGLIICFGMGTSFRSLVAWGANATAVELIPSVPKFFGFYFADGPELLRDHAGRINIEIDDGRRYLDRTRSTFDVISIDPPPPIEAAASSLLYSKEFYQSVRPRLKPNGILQAWLGAGDAATLFAVTQALVESFPHVRAFRSVKGWGIHYLASRHPIPRLCGT